MSRKGNLFLNKEECDYYINALKERCFSMSQISNKIFGGKIVSSKDRLKRVLNGKVGISSEDLGKLEFYCSSKIISSGEYERLLYIDECCRKFEKDFNKYDIKQF